MGKILLSADEVEQRVKKRVAEIYDLFSTCQEHVNKNEPLELETLTAIIKKLHSVDSIIHISATRDNVRRKGQNMDLYLPPTKILLEEIGLLRKMYTNYLTYYISYI